MSKSLGETLEEAIHRLPFYRRLRFWMWVRNGKKLPPPHPVKQQVLLEYAHQYHLKSLVETGTFQGRMIEAMSRCFEKIYSIELSLELCEKAKARFEKAPHVELIHGDSGEKIKEVLPRLKGPALFWLDGHYSGDGTALGNIETPILKELNCILEDREKGHVIVIDDARLFNGGAGYPTVSELEDFVRSKREDMTITSKDDTFRIAPGMMNRAA